MLRIERPLRPLQLRAWSVAWKPPLPLAIWGCFGGRRSDDACAAA
jgi:hypothetical protein